MLRDLSASEAHAIRRQLSGVAALFLDEYDRRSVWPGMKQDLTKVLAPQLLACLHQAEIVLWYPEVWSLAINGCESFMGTPGEAVDSAMTPQLWMFQTGANISMWPHEVMNVPRTSILAGVIVAPLRLTHMGVNGQETRFSAVPSAYEDPNLDHRDGMAATAVIADRNLSMPPYMRTIGIMVEKEPIPDTPLICEVLAAHRFMSQTIAAVEPLRVPRAERRRAQRADANYREPQVKVVYLRRREPTSKGHSNREYSCQWAVRGFWRRQWYPSEGVHRPKYIHEYVKGPKDKPFKGSTAERVVVVRR